MTDATGQAIVSYDYDAFGGLKSASSSFANDFQFTGEQWDSDAGLYYLRARYYDPEVGRFISRDPWPGDIANPQSLNRYVYAYNSPVNWTDPSGMEPPSDDPWDTVSRVQDQVGTAFHNVYKLNHPKYAAYSDIYDSWLLSYSGSRECMGAQAKDIISLRGDIALRMEMVEPVILSYGGTVRAGGLASSAKFGPNQEALVQLAKEARDLFRRTGKGISIEQARTLLDWAKEYKFKVARDHIGTMHWKYGSHVEIGPIDHIKVEDPAP